MIELLDRIPVSEDMRIVVGVGAIVVATLIAAWLAKFVLFVLARKVTSRTSTDLDDKLMRAARSHMYYLVYLAGAAVLFNYLETLVEGMAAAVFRAVDGALFVIAVAIVAHLIVRLTSALLTWYGETVAVRTETTVDDEFVPLLDRGVKIVTYVLALLIILDHFEVDIKGLVAVLGVGSLAIALASQETIANMIGGFVIMIDRPFRQGDRVRLDDGTVCVAHQIGIRSTKFRTFDNSLVIIPNADLMKSTIHNLTYPHPRLRVQVAVGVGYDSDIDVVRNAMLDEANKHPKVLPDPKPGFFFLNFGDSSLDVSLRCWVADPAEQFRTASELREQVLTRFRQEGIDIPFPQRVVTMMPAESPEHPPITESQPSAASAPGGEQYADSAGDEDDDESV